jgi:hypothetical protein
MEFQLPEKLTMKLCLRYQNKYGAGYGPYYDSADAILV